MPPRHRTKTIPISRAEIARRIEWLGQLNERRKQANEDNNLLELEAVAHEYEILHQPCTIIAKEIRIAIAIRKRKESPC